jgi:type II secretory pathway pseudopilin PulG
MAVFAILVTAALGILVRTTDVARTNTRRVVAANLANRAVESARSMRALDIPDGGQTRSEVVGNVTYTVTQTANYLSSGATTSVCSGSGSSLAYKLVTVTVTWPNMGSIAPVRADTLKSLGLGNDALDATKGSIALAVLSSRGNPVAGVDVTLTPGNVVRTTGTDGCAVFTGLTAATYSAALNMSGYVGSTGTQLTTAANLGVTAGQIQRGSVLYDTVRRATVALSPATGFTPPSTLGLILRNSYLSERTYPACTGLAAPATCVTGVRASEQSPVQAS